MMLVAFMCGLMVCAIIGVLVMSAQEPTGAPNQQLGSGEEDEFPDLPNLPNIPNTPGRPSPNAPGGQVSSGRHTGASLAVLEQGPLDIHIRGGAGAGTGMANFSKNYTGRPFPYRGNMVLAFDILFHPGFEWSCRGKVGGLYVGTGTASGGNYSPDAASHRLMWEGAGTPFSYVYVPQGSHAQQPPQLGRVSRYGQAVFQQDFQGALRTGTWHRVELGVRLNTVGRADGALLLGVDGKTRVLEGVVWRLGTDYT